MPFSPLLLVAALVPQSAPSKPASLEDSFLANEGFLLRTSETGVLLDAFITEPYGPYAALEAEAADKLFATEPPFDSIDLALTSHVHPDHFQVSAACRFLDAAPRCVFVSTPDVAATLKKECPTLIGDRVKSFFPKHGNTEAIEVGDVRVDVVRLSHGTGRFSKIQNLGHLVTMGGFRVLHLGDAAFAEPNYAPYDLAEQSVDVAFVPYWYFTAEGGKKIVAKHLKARILVAVHVPPREVETTAELLSEDYPDVVLFRDCMETRRFTRP